MTSQPLPPYWKNRWTEFNCDTCYKANCELVKVNVSDMRGQMLASGFDYCPTHRLFHVCGWSPCVEGNCSCGKYTTHVYNGARCPTYLDQEGYLCCEVTLMRLENYPSFPFENVFPFDNMETEDITTIPIDFNTAAKNYFIQKEGAVTEGEYDDIVYLSDEQVYPLLTRRPNQADFEKFIDPKLFSGNCHFDYEYRYKVYENICLAFRANLEFSVFKRKGKHNIRRAFHIACTQVFHNDIYKMLLTMKSFWSKHKTYRKLCRLHQHFYYILKVTYPIKDIDKKNIPPDSYLEELLKCLSLEQEKKKKTPTLKKKVVSKRKIPSPAISRKKKRKKEGRSSAAAPMK